MKKSFPLGTVMSITTQVMLAPNDMAGVWDLLEFMTGYVQSFDRVLRARFICKSAIYEQYPALDSTEAQSEISELYKLLKAEKESGNDVDRFIAVYLLAFALKFGLPTELEIQALPDGTYEPLSDEEEVRIIYSFPEGTFSS